MRIEELKLQNYRCFENETFRFDSHFNVVIGKNGSGKTTLLDALAVALSAYLTGIDERFCRTIGELDIRTTLIGGLPQKQMPVSVTAASTIHGILLDWNAGRYENGHPGLTADWKPAMIQQQAQTDLMNSRQPGADVIFPLIAYYGTGRLQRKQDKINFFKQKEEGVSMAYDGCLDAQISSDAFLSWYKSYEATIHNFKEPHYLLFLDLFRKTISSMVPQWTGMAYNFIEDDLMGIMDNPEGAKSMRSFGSLSSGYKNIIGLVADMTYRCILLNPGLKENLLLETHGVVLIDELDLHLHPEWQRTIVNDLKRLFPKVQFITTTHSPFIIQETLEGELIRINEGHVSTGGGEDYSLEDIAEYLQGIPDPAWSNRKIAMYEVAKKYFALLNELKPETGNEKVKAIREELNILGRPYSDNVAYTAFLEQKRLMAEQNLDNEMHK